MISPIFSGHVNAQGQLKLEQADAFERHRRSLAGKDVELVLRVPRRDRSSPQNRYYWGVVVALLAECFGYTAEEMHEALKLHFLLREQAGKALPTVGSTAAMNTQEFEDYLQSVRQWAAVEHGVVIPMPNEAEA